MSRVFREPEDRGLRNLPLIMKTVSGIILAVGALWTAAAFLVDNLRVLTSYGQASVTPLFVLLFVDVGECVGESCTVEVRNTTGEECVGDNIVCYFARWAC